MRSTVDSSNKIHKGPVDFVTQTLYRVDRGILGYDMEDGALIITSSSNARLNGRSRDRWAGFSGGISAS